MADRIENGSRKDDDSATVVVGKDGDPLRVDGVEVAEASEPGDSVALSANTAGVILAANADRTYASIANVHATDTLWLFFTDDTGVAVVNKGRPVGPAGDVYEAFEWKGAIVGICASGTSPAITEF